MANIKTRIITKHAEWEAWQSSTLPLLDGEIVLAKVTTEQTDAQGRVNTVPAYIAKVGDGTNKTFKDTAWMYAKAVDVHAWAKKASLDIADIPALTLDSNAASLIKAELDKKLAIADFETYETNTAALLSGLRTDVDAITTNIGNNYATKDELEAVEGKADANTTAIEKINGNETVEGSIAKALADAKSYADNLFDAEKLSRESGDATLQNNIDEVNTKIGEVAEGKTVVGLISEVQAAAEGEDNAIKGRLDNVEKNITLLQADNTDHDSRLDTLEVWKDTISNVMDFVGAVDELPTSVEGYNKGDVIVVIDSGKEYVNDGSEWVEFGVGSANEAAISTLQSDVETLEDDVEGLTTRVTVAEGELNNLQTNLDEVEIVANRADEASKTNATAIDTMQADYNTLSAKVNDIDADHLVKADKNELELAIDGKVAQADYDTEIAALETADTNLADRIKAIEDLDIADASELSDLAARVTALDKSTDGRVALVETQAAANATNISGIAANYLKVTDNAVTNQDGEVIIFDCGGIE